MGHKTGAAPGSLDSVSDGELVERMAGGDESALDAFYSRFGHLAYGLALRILDDAATAERVVLEAFGEIWRSSAAGAPSNPRNRLLSLVHRRCAEIVRASRAPMLQKRGLVPPAEPRWVSLEAEGGRELLSRIGAGDREALELAYYRCHTREEIAALLDLPVAEVTARIGNGLRRLGELQRELSGGPAILDEARASRPPD